MLDSTLQASFWTFAFLFQDLTKQPRCLLGTASVNASSHGVGNTAAVPDPERRVHRQHSNHDCGGGQFRPLGGQLKRCSGVVV
ncbi:hypothetical protein GOODEAATRI_002606 [Goodea atripinnis]|uniref:Secreted protein n=1 Tax=Goodea atripinnis TaxID=208336 RepID=A0ABV0PAT9_9TELE